MQIGLLNNEELCQKGENKIQLEYYKTINKKSSTYGIEIIKKNGKNREISCVKDVTKNEQMANRILEILQKNMVTPIALQDITEDLMQQYQIS